MKVYGPNDELLEFSLFIFLSFFLQLIKNKMHKEPSVTVVYSYLTHTTNDFKVLRWAVVTFAALFSPFTAAWIHQPQDKIYPEL